MAKMIRDKKKLDQLENNIMHMKAKITNYIEE